MHAKIEVGEGRTVGVPLSPHINLQRVNFGEQGVVEYRNPILPLVSNLDLGGHDISGVQIQIDNSAEGGQLVVDDQLAQV